MPDPDEYGFTPDAEDFGFVADAGPSVPSTYRAEADPFFQQTEQATNPLAGVQARGVPVEVPAPLSQSGAARVLSALSRARAATGAYPAGRMTRPGAPPAAPDPMRIPTDTIGDVAASVLPGSARDVVGQAGDALGAVQAATAATPINAVGSLAGAARAAIGGGYSPAAAAVGAVQGPSFGFGDELAGLAAGLVPGGEDYRGARDAMRAGEQQAMERAPGSYIGGAILGSAPLAALPAASGVQALQGPGAARALGRVAAAGLEGGAMGAVGGAGASRADLGSESGRTRFLRDVAEGAEAGGALGGGAAIGLEAAQATLPALARIAANRQAAADRQRLSALGAMKRDFDLAEDRYPGSVAGLAQDVREMGLTGRAARAEDLEQRAIELRQRSGQQIGDILASAEEGVPPASAREAQQRLVPTERLASAIEESVIAPRMQGFTSEMRAAAAPVQELVDTLRQRFPAGLTADDVQQLKQQVSRGAQYASRTEAHRAEAYRDVYPQIARILDESVAEAGQRVGDPAMLERFQQARREYRVGSLASDWIDDRAARMGANDIFGLSGHVQGSGGSGSLLDTAARMAGTAFLRPRQASMAATANESLAAILRTTPERFGRYRSVLERAATNRGEQGLAAAFYVLRHRDPDFAKAYDEYTTEPQ